MTPQTTSVEVASTISALASPAFGLLPGRPTARILRRFSCQNGIATMKRAAWARPGVCSVNELLKPESGRSSP